MATRSIRIQIKMRDKDPLIKAGNYSLEDLLEIIYCEINSEISRIDKISFERLRKKIINAWYHTYFPRYYQRRKSLYYFANPLIENYQFFIDYGLSGYHSSSHRVNQQYLYELVFQQGYHGGAISGRGHQHPGMPLWRYPVGEYIFWGYPATRGFPIEETLMNAWDNYVEQTGKPKAKKITEKVIRKYRKELLSFKKN